MSVPETETAAPTAQSVSFPQLNARTMRFTLGRPRAFTVSPDGARVAFLRSSSGTDRAARLWVLDLPAGRERQVADPVVLLGSGEEQLSREERARRERSRTGSAGVVGYACDRAVTLAAFALSSRLWVADLTGRADGPGVRELPVTGPVLDPRPDPTGQRIAFVAEGALRVADVDGGGERVLAAPDSAQVTWGLAEFVAAEEMDRHRGYWWAPDGAALLAARVDNSPVQVWHIADPARPEQPPTPVRYPAAGTPNAEVTLAVLGLDGSRTEVTWDRAGYPYLVEVHWSGHGDPLLLVQSRDQRRTQVLDLDPQTGGTTVLAEDADEHWVEISPGVPRWTPDGRLVRLVDDADTDTRRLVVADQPLTPPGLQVAEVVAAGGTGAVFTGSREPTELHVWRIGYDGALSQLSQEPGVHAAVTGGPDERTLVLVSATLERAEVTATVLSEGARLAGVRSLAEHPPLAPQVSLGATGNREIRTAVLLPSWWQGPQEGHGPLPVLLDPYGGPHHLEVVRAHTPYLEPQWLAEQGFAVVIADGRGTPMRGPAWERAIAEDWAGTVLQDQIDALHGAAARFPGALDLTRVAIRGWSFGGYLSALAVLRRPDVFHAGIAGAPVTDWSLYDTHYTERYLGTPQDRPEAYAAASLLADAARPETADAPQRPLLIIHGLADDNVVAAHTLRLSSALLAAGRPHAVLPLSGVTHMTPQEVVAENLLLLQVRFLREALAAGPVSPG